MTRRPSSGKRLRRVDVKALARDERRFLSKRCGRRRFDYFGEAFGDAFGEGDGLGGDGGGGADACGAAPDGAAAAGGGAGLASSNSTSKIKVELAGRSAPTARSPYARAGGTNN